MLLGLMIENVPGDPSNIGLIFGIFEVIALPISTAALKVFNEIKVMVFMISMGTLSVFMIALCGPERIILS